MKIDISQRQTLEFLIEVDGTNIDEVKSRLLLSENELMIGVDGTTDMQSDGQTRLVFVIPELKNIIKSQEVDARIEMFVENRFYVPYETTIEIERPVVFKVNESKAETNKSPFSVKNAKIIAEEKSQPKPIQEPTMSPEPEPVNPRQKMNEQKRPVRKPIENSFNFDNLLSEFESHGDFDKLKLDTVNAIQNNLVFDILSEDSKEKISVLKSKRVKTEELYFKIMESVLLEMVNCGVTVIIE